MIRNYIENIDTSDIPIGPQAQLIESLENLNNCIPPYANHLKLGVTKKFKWQRGTYKKVEQIKKVLTVGNTRYKNVYDAFTKQEVNSRNYYVSRFKRNLINIDKDLVRKRYDGSVWVEDEKFIENLKKEAFDIIVELFDSYKNYIKNFNKTDVKYITHNVNCDVYAFLNKELNDSFHKMEESKIILSSYNSKIYILHPFKDITMNVFSGEDTYPIYQYKIGSVLNCYSISVKWLLRWALGCSLGRGYQTNTRTSYWFKPYIQGNKHPFINFGYNDSNQGRNPNDWVIDIDRNHNCCFGNMSLLYGNTSPNFVEYYETANTWLSTFRLGITEPLNRIYTTFYGHPEKHDPNVDQNYMDRVGVNIEECANRMVSSITDVNIRNQTCLRYCKKQIMSKCDSFIYDIHQIKLNKIAQWHKNDLVYEYVSSENYKLSHCLNKNANDNYYMRNRIFPHSVSNTQNLQDDMLRWVNDVANP